MYEGPLVVMSEGGNKQTVKAGGIVEFESGSALIAPNPHGGQDYFVDLNVSASGDGKSWATAFGTIAAAIAASNTSIGLAANRWWARRNRIFVCGDGITESLTVLPEKCDVIGVGSDLYPFPRVIGAHAIVAAKVGCRFVNMGFQASGTGDLFVIPAGCHGLQFLDCQFIASVAGNTKGLEITDSACVTIRGCRSVPNAGNTGTGVFGIVVSIEGTVGHEIAIADNDFWGTKGVMVASTVAGLGSLIKRNTIRAIGLAIDDDSDTFQVVDNRWITDVNTGTSTAGWDFNLALACGNLQMGATGLCDSVPFVKIAES